MKGINDILFKIGKDLMNQDCRIIQKGSFYGIILIKKLIMLIIILIINFILVLYMLHRFFCINYVK